MKHIAIFGCLAVMILPGVAGAQEFSRFAVSGGAGFAMPVKSAADNLDMGWNVRGGVGVNFSPYVGAMLDLGYDSMGVNSSVLNNLGFGGGRTSVFSATIDPIVHLNPKGRFDFYVTGGGGYYRLNQDFTQPGVVSTTFFDPFFGFVPVSFGTNIVVQSYSVNKPGANIGAGVAFGSKWGGKFFAEARYEHIFVGSTGTDYIPVTFGFRK